MKMHLVIICVLFTSAFAQHYVPNTQYQYPMDYNDDMFMSGQSSIPSRLYFNYELRRDDQPPQVDMRDESFGEYMGRPKTTTATPPQRFRNMEIPKFDHSHVRRPVKPNTNSEGFVQQGQYRESLDYSDKPVKMHLPTRVPAGPPMPKWMDLSDDSLRGQKYLPSHYAVEHVERKPIQPLAVPWDEFSGQSHHHGSQPAYQHYESHARRNQKPAEKVNQQEPSRGLVKFSWGRDVDLEPTIETTTTAVAPSSRRSYRPPVPTLSPWSGDNFGK